MEKIQKENQSIYYEPDLVEVIEILKKQSAALESMDVKWTKEKGFELCNMYFNSSL